MLKLSIFGIMAGVFISLFLFITYGILTRHYFAFQKPIVKRSMLITIIILSIAITAFASVQMGYYVKTGDFSDHNCDYSSCKQPSMVVFHRSFDGNDYYCLEHYTFAADWYEEYATADHAEPHKYIDTFTPAGASVTCKSCHTSYRGNHSKADFIRNHDGLCSNCYSRSQQKK